MLATELQPGITACMGSRCEAGSHQPGERHTAASDSPCFPDAKPNIPSPKAPSLFSLHSFVQSSQYNIMSQMCVPPSVTLCSCRVHRIAYTDISPPLLFSSLSDHPDPLTRRTAAQASAAVAIRAYLAFDMLKNACTDSLAVANANLGIRHRPPGSQLCCPTSLPFTFPIFRQIFGSNPWLVNRPENIIFCTTKDPLSDMVITDFCMCVA